MHFRSTLPLVACLLVATAGSPTLAAGSDLFCTVESIPVAESCPESCLKPLRMRATEVDGERHLHWISTPAEPMIRTARSIDGETWTYSTIPLPANPNTLDVQGTLAVVGYGTEVRFFRLEDGEWVTEATIATDSPQQVRSLAIGTLDGVERVVVGSTSPFFSGAMGSGAALYRRDEAWGLETVFAPPPGTPSTNSFGFSVAIDGPRIVIAAPSADFFDPPPLSVHELVDGAWVAAATIARPAWLDSHFGLALALQGETLAVHARGDALSFTGVVQLFHRQAGTWTPMALLHGEGAGQWFGSDLDMIDDGEVVRLAIGVTRLGGGSWPDSDGPVLTAGWLYRLEQGVVLAATRLRAPGPDGVDRNARSVSIVPDGQGDFWIALSAPVNGDTSTFRIAERDTPDCDGDGVPDACAIIDDPSIDANLNGVPDSCESILGDLDGNGIVDGADLGLLLGAWGQSGGAADLNGDGIVDGADLGALLGAWTA